MAATTPPTAADEIRGWLEREPDAEHFEFPRAWLAELLAERDQLADERATNPAEFGIVALHDCALRSTWLQIHHVPCAETISSPADAAVSDVLTQMAAHRCEADGSSQ